jgi:hypothetical protein
MGVYAIIGKSNVRIEAFHFSHDRSKPWNPVWGTGILDKSGYLPPMQDAYYYRRPEALSAWDGGHDRGKPCHYYRRSESSAV